MRILVLGINYAPEKTAVAPFTTGLCEYLAARGHHVTVVTAFPYYPEWRVWDGYRGQLHRRARLNGVDVHRVWHFVPRRASRLLQRLLHDFSFALSALLAGWFADEFDLLYCSCPPPAVALAAYALSRLRGKPYVIKLTDLASDAALATGILQEGLAVRAARALEKFIYRHAAKVVCLCQGFVDKLAARGVSPRQLQIIPDWADTANVRPIDGATSFRRANGFHARQFVMLHTGNMGKKQELRNVVRAAQLSNDDDDLQWLLVGHGEERDALAEEIARAALPNIRLLPLQPAAGLAEMYSAADLLILNQRATVQDAVIPSKLLTYMAAGRPVLAAVSEASEAARLIKLAECGLVVPAGEPQALVDAALLLRQSPALCRRFGQNGRSFVTKHFTKQSVLLAYEQLFRRLTGEPELVPEVTRKAASVGSR